jgi:hypothetical protein
MGNPYSRYFNPGRMRLLMILSLFLFSCRSEQPGINLFVFPKDPLFGRSDSLLEVRKTEIRNGAIEYFTVNGKKFRFKKSDSLDKYSLEVFANDAWQHNLLLDMPRYSYYLTSDLDLDGYTDLTSSDYRDLEIHFFDPGKGGFEHGITAFSYDCVLLDSAALVYGANHSSMDEWDVDIFSIKGRKKTLLLNLEFPLIHGLKNNDSFFEKAYLSQYETTSRTTATKTLVDSIPIKKFFSEFSLRSFMHEVWNKYGRARK